MIKIREKNPLFIHNLIGKRIELLCPVDDYETGDEGEIVGADGNGMVKILMDYDEQHIWIEIEDISIL